MRTIVIFTCRLSSKVGRRCRSEDGQVPSFTTTTSVLTSKMTEENITVDEVIINIVRDNKCIYDKTDVHYKYSNKKKDIWKMIAFQLKEVYKVDMSAENVEKRWSALRDIFGREERKKKLPPSGSGYSESKEWYLYRPLLFLSSHIAHRKTQGSFIRKPIEDSSSQPVCLQQVYSQPESSKEYEAILEEISQDMCSSPIIDHTYSEPHIIDNNAQYHPESVTRPLSSCSSTSSFSSTPTNSKAVSYMKPTRKKIVPPMDDFAKRKKMKSTHLDEQLSEAGAVISDAMNTVSTLITSTVNKDKEKDGYIFAIEEGLKHVPRQCRTQCIIEVLQIIQKYEIRE